MKAINRSNTCAVMTTFYPEESIIENIERALMQVDLLILVDDSGHQSGKQLDFSNMESIFYIKNKKNIGIADSLNQGLRKADELGYDFVLTLDDDTVLNSKYLENVFEFLEQDNTLQQEIGIVCLSRQLSKTQELNYTLKRTIITSGSIISISDFNTVGGFDKGMFIDLVDFDYCLKIRKLNKVLVQINQIGMEHSVGNIDIKHFLGIKIQVYNHSPFRIYYQVRNLFIFTKRYFFIDPLLTGYLLIDIIRIPIKILIFEVSKKERLAYYSKGLIHGLLGRVGKVDKGETQK